MSFILFLFALTSIGIMGFLVGSRSKRDWKEEERLRALKEIADPLIQELEEISPELEKKIRILRSLIDEADKRILTLRSLEDKGKDPDIPRMIELGFEDVEISRGVGKSIGEIELIHGISSLRERRERG